MKWQAAWIRTSVAGTVGLVTGAVLWVLIGPLLAMAGGWLALALTFIGWTLLAILPFTPEQTAEHASREDPSHAGSALVLTLAAFASVAGVFVLLGSAGSGSNLPVEAILGFADVACSWLLVHTLYTVIYARLYFEHASDKPVDFNGDQPDYHDFAYLALTLGMTYQVSDTSLQTRPVRRAALRHALLSYLLGAVVLACTINLVVQLAAN
ncbi:MAG TPA: DUF1345 domain-containing protein [Micropruina sp.]|nr:DUF1345 domain-containing protein [Micropruina sp.]